MIFEELKVSAPPPLAESLHKYFRTSEMIIIFSMPDKTVCYVSARVFVLRDNMTCAVGLGGEVLCYITTV